MLSHRQLKHIDAFYDGNGRASSTEKIIFLAQFSEGQQAAESDLESGELTDCPYPTDGQAARDWYSGYNLQTYLELQT